MYRPSHILPLVTALALLAEGCSEEQIGQPAAGSAACGRGAGHRHRQPVEAALYRVTPGTVIAQESVQIASRLMGYIHDIAVAEGQPVKAGQRLFTIDPLDIQGAVEQASLGLRQAEDAMNDYQDRFRSLRGAVQGRRGIAPELRKNEAQLRDRRFTHYRRAPASPPRAGSCAMRW